MRGNSPPVILLRDQETRRSSTCCQRTLILELYGSSLQGLQVSGKMLADRQQRFARFFQARHHHRSLQAGDDDLATAAGSMSLRNSPFCCPWRTISATRVAPLIERGASFAAQHRIAIVAVNCCVEQRAASGKRAGRLLDKILHQQQKLVQEAFAIFQSTPAGLVDRLPRIVEGGGGKILLAIKVAIEAALFEAGDRHQLRH